MEANDIIALGAKLQRLGQQQDIQSRWSLSPSYPTPTAAERLFLSDIDAFIEAKPIVTTSGVQVQIGKHIDPYLVYLICANAYEHGDIRLIREHSKPAAKAVVLGGGIGIIASALALQTSATTIVYDANPALLSHIANTGAINGASLLPRHGAITRHGGSTVKFYLSTEFWASSTSRETYRPAECIEVRTISFQNALEDAEIAFIDIEGEETNLFHDALPRSLRSFFIEIHTPTIGAANAATIMNRIWRQGFELVDQQGLTSFWKR